MRKLPGHVQNRRREIDLAARTAKAHSDASARLHSGQLLQEIDVKEGAAKLPIRNALQSELFLEAHDLADGAVFHPAQLLLGDGTGAKLLAGLEQITRAQKAADVIGTEGRRGALHVGCPSEVSGNDPILARKTPAVCCTARAFELRSHSCQPFCPMPLRSRGRCRFPLCRHSPCTSTFRGACANAPIAISTPMRFRKRSPRTTTRSILRWSSSTPTR